MTHLHVSFSDIQTSELLYYDADICKDCLHFCNERDIDCLPALGKPFTFFRKTESNFYEEHVTPERQAAINEFIFNPSLLERFRANPLLFVYSGHELTGVVHYSDYNRPAVGAFLYDQLSSYERSLRRLLVLHGLKNLDMLNYFKTACEKAILAKQNSPYQRKLREYQNRQAFNDRLPAFERFYLLDLMKLAGDRNILTVDTRVNELRNMVMHSHELVYMRDANRNDYIYDFSSFEDFFKQVTALLDDFQRVRNRVAFKEMS